MSNFGKKLEKRKVFKDFRGIMEATKDVSGEDGKPVMPIFISENLSDFYFRKNPLSTAEIIKKPKLKESALRMGVCFHSF